MLALLQVVSTIWALTQAGQRFSLLLVAPYEDRLVKRLVKRLVSNVLDVMVATKESVQASHAESRVNFAVCD